MVILSPEPPLPETWEEVANLPNIFYIKVLFISYVFPCIDSFHQGSGMNSVDLYAAGVERAKSVVVLSATTPVAALATKHGVSVSDAADAMYLNDADVILTTRAIQVSKIRGNSVKLIESIVYPSKPEK